MAWCAAEMKPSKACLACSTLFSAKSRISGGTSKRSLVAMITSCKSAWLRRPTGRANCCDTNVSGAGRLLRDKVGHRACGAHCNRNWNKPHAYRRHPRMCGPGEVGHEKLELRFLRDDDLGRGGHHRCRPRRRPVVGFAFNSTGRYACGAAMRARFIPRILGADPRSLLDATQANFDPEKIL